MATNGRDRSFRFGGPAYPATVTTADDRLAASLVLSGDDLGEGWAPGTAEPGGEVSGVVTACVDDDFPHDHVAATADGAPWTRPPAAFAYSAALVLDGERAAASAYDALAGSAFGQRFAAEVAGEVGETQPAASWLGGTASTRVDGGAAVHHLTFAAADPSGVRPVHVDLVITRFGRAVVVLWLGDSPQPFPEGERRRLVARLRARAEL